MRTARRIIVTLVGIAFWSVVATTVAYAQRLHDPTFIQAPAAATTSTSSGTSNWKYALIAALAALMAVAIVGLVTSMRHSRESGRTPALHA